MNKFRLLLAHAVLALSALGQRAGLVPPPARYQFANNNRGIRPDGRRTYLADAAITTKGLLVVTGTDSEHIALAGTSSVPLGVALDEAEAAEDAVAVQLFGAVGGTVLVVASAAITAGDLVVAAASGKVRTLPALTGTYHIIGRAINAAGADGDLVEIAPSFPIQRVVP